MVHHIPTVRMHEELIIMILCIVSSIILLANGSIYLGDQYVSRWEPECILKVDTTIRETYGIDPPPMSATIAAVIYMFVEPEYRGRDVGTLALEVMSAIQSVQAVDFTVLVADDDGSGKVVRWYEDRGFTRAPLMQNVLGSPGEVNGVAMIAPVRIEAGFFDKCAVKWW